MQKAQQYEGDKFMNDDQLSVILGLVLVGVVCGLLLMVIAGSKGCT